MRYALFAAAAVVAILPGMAAAQDMGGMSMPMPAAPKPAPAPTPPPTPAPAPTQPSVPDAMPGMDMSQPMPGMTMGADPLAFGSGSGTSRVPGSDGGMSGLHLMTGGWMVMLHGYALAGYTAQSGPRGDDGAILGSMAMLSAERDLGGATLSLRSMFSLEPLIGARGYPSLFATGETADGVTHLVDRQHPHDFFMELAARIDVPLGGGVSGFVYGGPVAEPALGPSAFMHRKSAQYLALAPISHHWFDSTHVSFGVVTAGLSSDRWQLEASAFRGREPDQKRWDIETPKLDSWSVRATWTPSPTWSAQVSHARVVSPEALDPDIDEARTSASVQYSRGGLAVTAGFAAKNRLPGRTLTAWFGEANWDVSAHHSVFGRLENVGNDELFPNPSDPLHDRAFRVTRAEAGYAHRIALSKRFALAVGGSGFVLGKPAALDAAYGKAPTGWTGFVKLSLGK